MASNIMSLKQYWGSKVRRRAFVTGMLFISPAIIGFLVFTLFPVIRSFYYGFTDYNILQPERWIGLDNYTNLLSDEIFLISLRNTLYMVLIGLPIHIAFDIFVAFLLNVKIRGLSIMRTIYYLPSITPVVAATVLWLLIFNGQIGLLNTLLHAFGIPAVGWLTNPVWTKPAFILMGLWGGGNTILIYLAALQDVSVEELEAAELDGAGTWAKTWNVTLPAITPAIFYTLVLNLIGYFQIFASAWVLTAGREGVGAGGPSNSLMFYAMYLYQNAFMFFKMGYASAMAWILLIIVLIFTYVLFRTSGWVYYRGDQG
jgi:multiple sugar transport system permease protein